MVNNEIQTTLDSPIQTTVESPIKTMLDSTMNQAVPAVIREPNKIGGCTPYDFRCAQSDRLWRPAAGGHHAGKSRLPAIGR